MQRTNRNCGSRALILAWAGATTLACSSDHYIGDLELPAGTPGDGMTAIDVAGADLRVSPNLTAPDVSMESEDPLRLGLALRSAGLGDVDGDGFDDYASIGTDNGVEHTFVTLRYGGPRPTDFAAEFAFIYGASRLTGPTASPEIVGVAPAGDIDADGHADVLVTLGFACDSHSGPDGAYLVYGGPSRLPATSSLDDIAIFLPRPQQASPGDSCGYSMESHTGVGDVDADGFDDFVISETRSSAGGLAKAYLFYGRPERLASGTSWLDADLRLLAEHRVFFEPLGDIDADGFADVLLQMRQLPSQESVRLLRGRAERFEGDQLIDSLGVAFVAARPAGDLDGDGTADVLLYDEAFNPHLFYGAPGRFDGGVDLSTADATFLPFPGQTWASVIGVGDLDGDGDDELAARFFDQWAGFAPRNVDLWGIHTLAFISGSRTRLSGIVAAPAPGTPFVRGIFGGTGMDAMVSLGDIDGDGAADLLSTTQNYSQDPVEGWKPASEYIQDHIHFGVQGGTGAEHLR